MHTTPSQHTLVEMTDLRLAGRAMILSLLCINLAKRPITGTGNLTELSELEATYADTVTECNRRWGTGGQ